MSWPEDVHPEYENDAEVIEEIEDEQPVPLQTCYNHHCQILMACSYCYNTFCQQCMAENETGCQESIDGQEHNYKHIQRMIEEGHERVDTLLIKAHGLEDRLCREEKENLLMADHIEDDGRNVLQRFDEYRYIFINRINAKLDAERQQIINYLIEVREKKDDYGIRMGDYINKVKQSLTDIGKCRQRPPDVLLNNLKFMSQELNKAEKLGRQIPPPNIPYDGFELDTDHDVDYCIVPPDPQAETPLFLQSVPGEHNPPLQSVSPLNTQPTTSRLGQRSRSTLNQQTQAHNIMPSRYRKRPKDIQCIEHKKCQYENDSLSLFSFLDNGVLLKSFGNNATINWKLPSDMRPVSMHTHNGLLFISCISSLNQNKHAIYQVDPTTRTALQPQLITHEHCESVSHLVATKNFLVCLVGHKTLSVHHRTNSQTHKFNNAELGEFLQGDAQKSDSGWIFDCICSYPNDDHIVLVSKRHRQMICLEIKENFQLQRQWSKKTVARRFFPIAITYHTHSEMIFVLIEHVKSADDPSSYILAIHSPTEGEQLDQLELPEHVYRGWKVATNERPMTAFQEQLILCYRKGDDVKLSYHELIFRYHD